MVVDHSSYTDTGSTFMNNTAADNGRFAKCHFKISIMFSIVHDILLNFKSFNNIVGGAISVHDHSVLNSTNTNFTGNKAESLYDKNPHCPPGLYVYMKWTFKAVAVNIYCKQAKEPVCNTVAYGIDFQEYQ